MKYTLHIAVIIILSKYWNMICILLNNFGNVSAQIFAIRMPILHLKMPSKIFMFKAVIFISSYFHSGNHKHNHHHDSCISMWFIQHSLMNGGKDIHGHIYFLESILINQHTNMKQRFFFVFF